MKTSASLSVIIPCYKCKGTIERAVNSIVDQTLSPVEIILIDDFSNDGTLDLLYEIQNKFGPSWVKVVAHLENVGPGIARNIGWDLSKEKYIAFLDSDDTWHPQKIEFQYNWMTSNDGVSLSSHSFDECKTNLNNSKLSSKNIFLEKQFRRVKPLTLLLSNIFLTPSVMIKRDLPYRFREEKRYSEDFLLWCEIILDRNLCFYSKSSLFFLHKAPYGDGGLSGNLKLMELGELDTYKQLNKSNRLSFLSYKVLSAWSILKYLRRLGVIKLRHLTNNNGII